MTNNQKILIGLGAVALAYYFYTKSKGSGTESQLSQEIIDCLRGKLTKLTDAQFNKLVENNFSETSLRSLIKETANPNADINTLTKSSLDEFNKILRDCKNPTPNPCKNPDEVPCNNGSGKCYSILAKYKSDPCKIEKEATPYGLNTPKRTEVTYTCKDGSKETRTEGGVIQTQVYRPTPCLNKGGISRVEEKFLS